MGAFGLTYILFPFELEASLDDFAVYGLRVASLFCPVLGVMQFQLQPVSQPKPCAGAHPYYIFSSFSWLMNLNLVILLFWQVHTEVFLPCYINCCAC